MPRTRLSRRSRGVLVAVTVVVALPAASDAHAALYRASITGQQELTWKVDGTQGSCEIRRGTGSGKVAFRFRSQKSQLLNGAARRLSLQGSLPSVATGSIAGTFTEATQTPCPGFEPRDATTSPADGCGPTRFGIRVDLTPRGSFVHLTGPSTPLGPVSIAQAGGSCPFPVDESLTTSSDFKACGDGRELFRRSWGVASSGGRGLFASRISSSSKRPLRKGASRRLTGRAVVDCTMESSYSGGVQLKGTLRYTLTVKRVR